MRKTLIILLITASVPAFAQRYSELGLFAGGTNFIGDVGAQGLYPPQSWVGGLAFRYQMGLHYAIRAQVSYGEILADDANSNIDFRIDRNQSFRSPIFEASLMMEINFLEYVTGSRRDRQTPYLFGGIGIFNYNPQALYTDGNWYDLQPMGTEGQGTKLSSSSPYGLSGVCLPFGLGYRFSLGDNISLTIESGIRLTSTDFLDDTSGYYVDNAALAAENGAKAAYFADRSITDTDKTGYARGSQSRNDVYVFTGFHLYFALTSKNERCSRF